jgi:phosphatidylglycerol:prolipoprotein diacylglycerol transferase
MNFSAALWAACVAVFGGLHISAYALIAIAGMLGALWMSLRTARMRGLAPDALWDAGVVAIVAAFVISRALGFLLLLVVEHGRLTLSFRDVLSFSSISYLSLIVTAAAVVLWLRWKRLLLLRVMDAWAPCGALLWAALSLADAAAGAGGGMPTRLPWGVRAAGSSVWVHPVAMYSAVIAIVLCGVTWVLLRRVRVPGRVAGVALIVAGAAVFLLDMLRVPEQPMAQSLLDASQWLALIAIACGAFLLTFTPRAESR